jgi:short-subunit dehydrogenase
VIGPNTTALITGGSSGIGKQIAADFLRLGASVVVSSNDGDRVQLAVRDLERISPRVSGLACDVGDSASVLGMAERMLADHRCPDVLVNNAGFATYRTVVNSDIAEIERIVGVNFLGAVRCTKAFLPDMIRRGSGSIVNMASIAGRMIITPNGSYCASKHALVAWSEVLRYELAPYGLRVHTICPGRVATAFFDHPTFQTRSPRRETRYTISVEAVSRATLSAIQNNRFLTYIPWTFGLLVWLTNTFPYLVKPIYGKLLLDRLQAVYAQEVEDDSVSSEGIGP